MFDDSPIPGHAGELDVINGTRRFCVRGKCTVVDVDDAGNVLQLSDLDGSVGLVELDGSPSTASSDAGAGELEHDAATVDAGNTGVSDAGPLERDATDSSTPELDAGAGDAGTVEPGKVVCAVTCIDGTFKCPSASSSSGYVCRSWPPCYCTPDGGS